MIRKKLTSIICALLLTTTVSGVLPVLTGVNSIVVQAATIEGLQTPTGVITSKVKLKDSFPTDPNKINPEYLKTISISVNPTDNPEMFNKPIDQYELAPHKNYLTDNIYYYGRIHTYPTGDTAYADSFLKILSVDVADKKNYVTVTYARIEFVNGKLMGDGRDVTQTYEDKKVYDYLIAEKNNDTKNPTNPQNPTNPNESKTYSSIRLGGADRYETSLAIANKFSSKVNNVILASGLDFPDSLSASTLSKKLNAPILLINKNANNSKKVLDYIKENVNKEGNIYILGGTSVVSDDIVTNLKSYGFKNFSRLGGADRYETNRLINKQVNVSKGTPVVIASGLGFADALSISSVSGIKGMPIYLTKVNEIDSHTLSEIKKISPNRIYIVGGTSVISSNVENTLKSITSDITRLGGANRYETSIKIAQHFNLDTDTATIASGRSFADALSGTAVAIKNNSPIILTDGKEVSLQKKYIDSTPIKNLYILGGTSVVSENIVNKLKE